FSSFAFTTATFTTATFTTATFTTAAFTTTAAASCARDRTGERPHDLLLRVEDVDRQRLRRFLQQVADAGASRRSIGGVRREQMRTGRRGDRRRVLPERREVVENVEPAPVRRD